MLTGVLLIKSAETDHSQSYAGKSGADRSGAAQITRSMSITIIVVSTEHCQKVNSSTL